jgi:hypothetical protein
MQTTYQPKGSLTVKEKLVKPKGKAKEKPVSKASMENEENAKIKVASLRSAIFDLQNLSRTKELSGESMVVRSSKQ